MFDLSGSVAIVTGGHGELGEAMADALAQLGCSVALAARKVDACEEVAHRLAARHGVKTMALGVDVSNEDDVEGMVAAVTAELGTVDVTINSAATFWGSAPEDVPTEKPSSTSRRWAD